MTLLSYFKCIKRLNHTIDGKDFWPYCESFRNSCLGYFTSLCYVCKSCILRHTLKLIFNYRILAILNRRDKPSVKLFAIYHKGNFISMFHIELLAAVIPSLALGCKMKKA